MPAYPDGELARDFFGRDTHVVARDLIGRVMFRQVANEKMACRIVEAEAYLPSGDEACHAAKKRTPKNEVMFGRPGLIYVYSIHAKFCINFVTEREGVGCAVLVRAAEPVEGLEIMNRFRPVDDVRQLMSGPSKLCQAMGIDKGLNGAPAARESGLWLENGQSKIEEDEILVTKRIGVTSAKEKQLRFVLRDSPFASGPKYMR